MTFPDPAPVISIYTLAFAAAIGIVAGLRSMTGPAAVSWAAYLGWLNLSGSPLSFMNTTAAVAVFSILAVAEYVADKLPRTPNRTRAGPLVGRILMGALAGACLTVSAGGSLLAGAGMGSIGAVAGAFTGYEVRRKLVRDLEIRDLPVALAEDLVAIVLALLLLAGARNYGGAIA
ncbi:MAG TPA: DUF4126 family protein [Gemmatimonadales bacterium]|nr:DUF4126 family protein [Gemmatimonadales bacterium]